MNTRSFLLAAGFGLAVAFTFFGCDESKVTAKPTNDNLVGTWESFCNVNLQWEETKKLPFSIEFFNDGTGIFYEDKKETGMSIKWQLREGNRLQVDAGVFGTQIHDIELTEKGTFLNYHYDGLKPDDKNPRKAIYIKKGAGKEGAALNKFSSFTDKRDGKKYKTTEIGDQIWMAENLNFEAEGSKCHGEGGKVYIWDDATRTFTNSVALSNDEAKANCKKYGRLYNWETAMKACPAGWHLPTNEEWDKLYRYADGTYRCVDGNSKSPYKSETAGKYLKAASSWNENKKDGKSGNGEDKFGFAALPGGGGLSSGSFNYAGDVGYWWSSGEYGASTVLGYLSEYASWLDSDKSYLRSVRCVKD